MIGYWKIRFFKGVYWAIHPSEDAGGVTRKILARAADSGKKFEFNESIRL